LDHSIILTSIQLAPPPPFYTNIFIFSLDIPSLAAASFPCDSAPYFFLLIIPFLLLTPFHFVYLFTIIVPSYPFIQFPSPLLLLLLPHLLRSLLSLQIKIKSIVASSPTFEFRSYVAFPLVCIEEHVW
jgi:hypothetical protein